MQRSSLFRLFWTLPIVGLSLFLLLSSCQASLLINGGTGYLRLALSVSESSYTLLPKEVANAVYETSLPNNARFFNPDTRQISIAISAADMTTINIGKTVAQGQTSITIDIPGIPAGIRRTVTISLYNSQNVLLAVGSSTFNIQAGRVSSTSISAIPQGATPISNGVIDIPTAIGVYCFQATVDKGIQGLILEDYGRGTPDYLFETYPFIKVYNEKGQLVASGVSGLNRGITWFYSDHNNAVFFYVVRVSETMILPKMQYFPNYAIEASTFMGHISLNCEPVMIPEAGSLALYSGDTDDPLKATFYAYTDRNNPQITTGFPINAPKYFWLKAVDSNGTNTGFLAYGEYRYP